MTECPSDADLTGFLNESLAPDQLAGLSVHVDGCAHCQTRLDRLTHDSNSAVARYKELPSIISTDPRTVPSSPDAGTLILGGDAPIAGVPRLRGVPHVPGFDVAAEIGRGGMGVVYKARHRGLNRLCALKMVLAGGAADTVTVQRFLFEAEVLARVQHPQVVQVFEVDTYQGPSGVPIPYLAMELLEGGSLARRIQDGPMPSRVAAELIEGLARAVHAAHLQGVIHRDLKPGNILFPEVGIKGSGETTSAQDRPPTSGSSPTSDSMRYAPKVTDFGLAKFIEAGAEMTQSGQVVGTPHYMAPEQAAGKKRIGPTADVYALGAILFECLTGRRPFEGTEPMAVLLKVVNEPPPDVRSLRPEVPRDLAAVVARCLEKEPRRRYPSAIDFADDLRRFLENRPTVARPLRRRERFWLWAKRNPAVAALTAALGAVLVLAFVLITMFWLKAEDTAVKEREAKDDAKRLTLIATQNEKDATEQRGLAERRQAELEFARSLDACEEGRVADGLRGFLHALVLAEKIKEVELARVIRINIAAWQAELPPPRIAFPQKYQPRQAAFVPRREQMVTVGREGEVHLWDLATQQKIQTYRNPNPLPNVLRDVVGDMTYWTVAVSPDGKTIAAGGTDAHITLWDADSLKRRARFLAVNAGGNVWALSFAPDGTLWSNDGDSGLKRWDLTTLPEPTATPLQLPPKTPSGELQALVVSPDGTRVYSGDRAGIIREWDANTGKVTRIWEIDGWVSDIAIKSDGSRLGVVGPDGVARVFHLNSGRSPTPIDLAGSYGNGIAFAPKHPFVLTSDGDGNVRVWHQDTGQPIGIPYRFSGEVTKIRFRPDSDEFAVPAGDTVYLTRVPDPPGDVLSAGFEQRIRGLDFSAKGDRLAVTDESHLQVFDPLNGERVQWLPYVIRSGGKATRVILQPLSLRYDPNDGRSRVFRGTRSGFDRIDVPTGGIAQRVPTPLFKHLVRVREIEFLHGGREILAMDDTALGRYDAVTFSNSWHGRPIPDLPAGVDLKALAVRPDGGEVLVGADNRVVFLHPDTLKPIREWRTRGEVLDAKYTPKGDRILIGRANVAELLDATTGAPVTRPMPHTLSVPMVAVSPNGQVLLTGSRDGTARFWDSATGFPLGGPLRHRGPVTHVRYAPDGAHIATGTDTGHVMIWDIPPPPTQKSLDELRAELDKLAG